jgi:hypothetical protein
MSENPNPTRCGNCGAMNPPGQEFCVECHAPLTITADADVLANTPESPNELSDLESTDTPGIIEMGGPLSPATPLIEESYPDERPRD